MTEKRIEIRTLIHTGTGLMMAVCDELKGFSVVGDTYAEIERKLPDALRDHFDLLGFEVGTLDVHSEDEDSGFRAMPPAIIAEASLREKATV
jgi:hypothetical protein